MRGLPKAPTRGISIVMLRFAPSPTGPLHLGHALSLFANEAMAGAMGLPLTVRIEDIDQTRARPEHEAAILEDIAWLGVAWQPPMRRQSEHLGDYADALARLDRRGLLVPSFATRREIQTALRTGAPRDPDGAPKFPGDDSVLGPEEAARRRKSDAPKALRLAMAKAMAETGPLTFTAVAHDGSSETTVPTDPAAWGDVVLARKDAATSYHLAVTIDDAAQNITHVVRGHDLLAATAIHRVLQTLLDLPPPRYHHHRLVLGEDGRKLSKSDGASGLGRLRAAGHSPADIEAMVGLARSRH